MEDAMRPQAQHPGLRGWQRPAGTWAAEATHPALPGIVVTGQATSGWLEDQRYLIQRSHYDHPEIPDAVFASRARPGTAADASTARRTISPYRGHRRSICQT